MDMCHVSRTHARSTRCSEQFPWVDRAERLCSNRQAWWYIEIQNAIAMSECGYIGASFPYRTILFPLFLFPLPFALLAASNSPIFPRTPRLRIPN